MVLHLARKLTASVLGRDPNNPMSTQELKKVGVPVSEASCRSCADPCDEGHAEFEKRFDVDMETDMRGSVKPYRRQILISTGKTDWVHDISSENDSLAKYITSSEDQHSGGVRKKAPGAPSDKKKEKREKEKARDTTQPAGVYPYRPSGRLSIVNGSHHSIADDPDRHATVLVLPDYVAVSNVPIDPAGADAFWTHALDPAVPRAGTVVTSARGGDEFKTWTLPYNCLIMLCSHKKRDARCHIASQRLQEDFAYSLSSEGWHVDTDLEDLSSLGPPLETIAATDEAREEAALAQLRSLTSPPLLDAPTEVSEEQKTPQTASKQKKALILKNSHIGGHKFAGNVIIYFPQGPSVWYGRVTPHEVSAIVQHTILSGKVLPQLFRGGLGIARPGRASLLDW